VVLRVEFDGIGEKGDGGIVVLSLEGFVSLVFEFVDLCNLISYSASTSFEGATKAYG